MDDFRIFETDQFKRDLERDFRGRRAKIRTKLAHYVYPQLRQNPYFGKNIKKLRNYEPQTWRYRVGDFRFFYTVDDQAKNVFMITADNREDAY